MYWDPFDEIHEEMDRMFRTFWGGHSRPMIAHKGHKQDLMHKEGFRCPRCHLQETESKIIATFELPGVSKADIELLVDDDHLELKVVSKVEKKEKQKEGYHYASHKQSFFRKIPLLKKVDSDKAEAEYKNGILKVEVPKKKKVTRKRKKINVK